MTFLFYLVLCGCLPGMQLALLQVLLVVVRSFCFGSFFCLLCWSSVVWGEMIAQYTFQKLRIMCFLYLPVSIISVCLLSKLLLLLFTTVMIRIFSCEQKTKISWFILSWTILHTYWCMAMCEKRIKIKSKWYHMGEKGSGKLLAFLIVFYLMNKHHTFHGKIPTAFPWSVNTLNVKARWRALKLDDQMWFHMKKIGPTEILL